MKPRPLFIQLFGSYLVITSILLFIFIIIAGTTFRNFYYTRISDDLRSRAELVKDQFLYNLSIKYYSRVQEGALRLGKSSKTHISIFTMDGKAIADSEANPEEIKLASDKVEFKDAVNHDYGLVTRFNELRDETMMYVAIPIEDAGQKIAILRLGVPITSLRNTLKQINIQLIIGGFICAILVGFLSWFLSRKMSKPLEEIRETAEKIKQGDFSSHLKFKPSATLEVQALGSAMNQMATQLEKRIETITSQKNELDTVFASMSEGLLAVDLNGKIRHLNSSACKILKLDIKKAKGVSYESAISIAQIQHYISESLKRDFVDEQEIKVYDKKKITLRIRGSSLKNTKGEKTGVVIVINDITEIVLAEKQRRDFVTNVSHELRTPLTSIQGFAETLMNPAVKNSGEINKFVEIIYKHATRLGALIEDILALSRLEKDAENNQIELSIGNLEDTVKNAVDICKQKASKQGIEITSSCQKGLQLRMNSHLLEQAIVNLVDNALKYSETNSKIEIKAYEKEGKIRVDITDYGAGISEKHLARLFERFYRIDKARSKIVGGTGLGLAIVKHVAMAHNGQVEVTSEIGKGSTFSLVLPVLS